MRDTTANRINVDLVIGSLDTGGAEGQVLHLLKSLDRNSFKLSVTVFTAAGNERARDFADDVFCLDVEQSSANSSAQRIVRGLQAARRFRKQLRRNHPDILHAFLPAACVLATVAGKTSGVPIVIGSRRSMADAYRRDSAMLAVTDRWATRRCDFVLGNSEAVTRELRELDGVPVERSATIYNGVDTGRFRPGDARDFRRQYGWAETDLVFGTVANFFAYKRHCDLITAAQKICREFSKVKFVLAGQDRGELAAVRDQVQAAGLEKAIAIIPGIADPAELYRAIDVYVCSSETEGFSNVLLEAMACGKPVIATDVGGNAEAVVHGSTGIIVPPLAPGAIADAALALAHAPELRERMGQKGRVRVEEQFSLEQMVRAHEELYIRLASGGGEVLPVASISQRTEPVEGIKRNG